MPLRVRVPFQLAESAALGGAILGALHVQRRALEGATQRHEGVLDELEESATVMQRMMRRVLRRRAFYMSIAGLLVVAIVVAWWLKANLSASHDSNAYR